MKRPLLIRMAPDRLRLPVWSRLYSKLDPKWLPLYQSAALRFAPQVSMELVPGDLLSNIVAFTGIHELKLTRRLLTAGRQGGTLVDIGANLGYFTLLWASCNPQNKVLAFEASPRNIDLLRRNVARNGFDGQVQVIPCAAGLEAGKSQFYLGPAEQRGWGGLALDKGELCVEIDVVRVDEVITSTDPIAFMKVDTEGADLWALKGCDRLLKAGLVREIAFEVCRPRCEALGISPAAAPEYLRSVGYTTEAQGDPAQWLVEWIARPA
jgi:FkbM family methyltransferase